MAARIEFHHGVSRRHRQPGRIGHNGAVTSGKRAAPGRHAGPARLEEKPGTTGRPKAPFVPLLLLALGITAAIVAWGYLVFLAIDLGRSARNGESAAWWLLGLCTIGAIACLFVAMMLGIRLVARMRAGSPPPASPGLPGGRRAAR
jgi:hypothetical protein